MDAVDRTRVRQSLKIQGQVQGVGFRPWVRQQALALTLTGWVRNTHDGVVVALQGPPEAIQAFKQRLHETAPGHIARIEPYDLPAGQDATDSLDIAESSGFFILPSLSAGTTQRCIAPDTAVCEECLKELFEPTSRRWRHPFIHCTQCGPRFTTLTGWPFDRDHTTMAHFEPCADCRQEYAATHDRRCHDQTICCPHCGPRLQLFSDCTDASSHHPQGSAFDPIREAYRRLKQGQILAIQGTGGFHLCCDAQQADAVAKLRRVKQRPHQPFAMMCANLASAHRWAHINEHEAHWLQHPGRPIVLLTAKPDTLALKGMAPGLTQVGMMLPTSPVQYLLFHEAADQAQGTAWLTETQDLTLVMTSGNVHGAPLIKDPEEAIRAFAGMADAILWHDQSIAHRADDSVMRVRSDGSACWLRKSRGWVPQPLTGTATTEAPQHILALGGDLKHTQCEWMSDGAQWHAWVGPHIGHLQNPDARELAWSTALQTQQGAHDQPLDIIVSDLHPDYASHHMAATLASQVGAQHVCVPHHVAHVAAVLAEQAAMPDQAVLAWVVDGQGWGTDGQAWGGELLWMRGRQWQRLGHLQPLALPGGDRAAKEPWRMAAAALHACGLGDQITQRWPDEAHNRSLQQWLNSGAVPHTTSLGRLFDAVAGLLGLLSHSTFEAHAAMWLEAAVKGSNSDAIQFADHLATTASAQPPTNFGSSTAPLVLDWRPWFRAAAQRPCLTPEAQAHMAAAFHEYISMSMSTLALHAAQQHQVDTVVLTGGCMANRLLDERVTSLIQAKGLKVWRAAQYPCGDGGLSLGQAWYAHLPHTTSAPMKA